MNIFVTNWQLARQHALTKGLRIVEHGWEQHVIIDEPNGIIYRYPRHQAAADKLKDEVTILNELESVALPLKIPRLIDYNSDFATYRYITGEVLSPQRVASISSSDAARIGSGIGEFLAVFHALNPKIIDKKQTKHATSLLEYYQERIFKGSKTPYYPDAIHALDELITHTVPTESVVLHGDLHGLNIVVRPTDNQLTGVIDLSEMETGDPHQEFRKLFMTIPSSLDKAIESYEKSGGQQITRDQVLRWAYVNEWANACYFYDQPDNLTYRRAIGHLKEWGQL